MSLEEHTDSPYIKIDDRKIILYYNGQLINNKVFWNSDYNIDLLKFIVNINKEITTKNITRMEYYIQKLDKTFYSEFKVIYFTGIKSGKTYKFKTPPFMRSIKGHKIKIMEKHINKQKEQSAYKHIKWRFESNYEMSIATHCLEKIDLRNLNFTEITQEQKNTLYLWRSGSNLVKHLVSGAKYMTYCRQVFLSNQDIDVRFERDFKRFNKGLKKRDIKTNKGIQSKLN